MSPVSLVPSLDAGVHLVLCDFGRSGLAYVETDPAEADATAIVRNLLRGEYERPLRIIAINADEGWSRDVSAAIAAKVREVAEGRDLTSGTLAFIEAQPPRDPNDADDDDVEDDDEEEREDEPAVIREPE